ncbi:MAG TPA: sterol desaturase family protein [Candidatus Binatia bacterium]|jgi:sterol desaturase/sphingolipid hydroxylase (fatty acid hydroxylase superfamily)
MTGLEVAAIPVFIVTMLLEAAILRGHPEMRGYEVRDTRASIAMGIVNVLINSVAGLLQFALLTYFSRLAPWHLDAAGWQAWQAWLIAFVAVDFAYYWFHRASHDVRILWAAHVNHHSSERYNLSTALRQSWTTPLTSMPFYWPLALAGIDPVMIFALEAVNTLYQYWIHTELVDRIGWLEMVFNTASHHRVHHGTNIEYLDRNHGGVFIVWDKLFGTFEPERAPVRYGLTKNIRTFRLLDIAMHEFRAIAADVRRARGIREVSGYLFASPGWSPDGTTLTSRQLRAAAAASSEAPDVDALQAAA